MTEKHVVQFIRKTPSYPFFDSGKQEVQLLNRDSRSYLLIYSFQQKSAFNAFFDV